MSITDGLKVYRDPCNRERCFLKSDIEAVSTRIHDLGEFDGFLAIRLTEEHWIEFALFQWVASLEEGEYHELVFEGRGTADPLREMRHTNWARDGYCFYMNLDLVSRACQTLKQYFD